jgi:hypothetical protein
MSSASVIIRIITSGRPASRRSATRSMPMPIRNISTIATGKATHIGAFNASKTASATKAPSMASAPWARLGTEDDL